MPEMVQTPRTLETRWPCPVCVGALMEKKHVDGPGSGFTIDFCPRCGGIWFDRGEVGEMARRDRTAITGITPTLRVNPPCHKCGAPLDRNAEKCEACGHKNVIACPVCNRPMERRVTNGLVLDLCGKCQGVWFDNAELTAIWRLNMRAALDKRRGNVGNAAMVGGDVLLEAMFWSPGLVVHGGMALGQAAGAAAEVAGQAATGVFDTIFEIIGGLFE